MNPKVKLCRYCELELSITSERNGHYTYGNCDCHRFEVWVERLQDLTGRIDPISKEEAEKFLGRFMRAMRSR